jgi:hypothetical protein
LTPVSSTGIIETSMRTADPVRALLSVVLTWAMAWTLSAPPVHAHLAGIEGRRASLVHAHPQGAARRAHPAGSPETAALAADHGDHSRALFLDVSFEGSSNRWMPAMALPARALLPAPRTARSAAPDAASRAHSPPLRVSATRGPPSLS